LRIVSNIQAVIFIGSNSPQVGTQSAVSSNGHTARAAISGGEPRLDHTRREEAEGKAIWERLQAKQLECKDLTNDNFESLGEYFMGQMLAPSGVEGAGSSHEMMNKMMVRIMGEGGEREMHIAIGKRNSGCDTSVGFAPMMGSGFGNMMGRWGGFGVLGWFSLLLFWVLLILGVVALTRYLVGLGKRGDEGKSPLDILKERYARGEIDKKEFAEMKKDLR